MNSKRVKFTLSGALVAILPLVGGSVYAAKPLDLNQQKIGVLQTITANASFASANGIQEINRAMDENNTLHVRIQQTYAGYKVWGADAVVHVRNGIALGKQELATVATAAPNADMDGTMYQNLQADLGVPPTASLAQSQVGIQQAIKDFNRSNEAASISQQKSNVIVYVDQDNKAQWAYEVSFHTTPKTTHEKPARWVYLINAKTAEIYAKWDDIKTIDLKKEVGGGFGGNIKMGKVVYDGLKGDLASLKLQRDAKTATCYMENEDVIVRQFSWSDEDPDNLTASGAAITFPCEAPDAAHNNTYWHGEKDAVNDGYSPSDDALFGGMVIKDMYKKWYKVPVLANKDGKLMQLHMVVHYPDYDNAYWDGTTSTMTFGDGETMFYPLTSLGVAAHEVSHGFTEQNSGLQYYGQSGGLNEAFSDMAAQAAELYAYKKNSWQIGPEIFKEAGKALRYMDKPSKDCQKGDTSDKMNRRCSIDSADEYYSGIDVHYSSGVYNRFFYLLGSSKGWNAKKAFDVMVTANKHYWTSAVDFKQAACGVLKATADHKYSDVAVKKAFAGVKIDISACTKSDNF
ncbi:MAG: M4 family metallopeptidase [Gammaproteobacteria bacterium]